MHAAWDLLPFMTGRTLASLTLDLPRLLVAGYRSEVRDLRGRYVAGQNVFWDQSDDLEGTVEDEQPSHTAEPSSLRTRTVAVGPRFPRTGRGQQRPEREPVARRPLW